MGKDTKVIGNTKGWKIVKGRWIDINKGDVDNPNYRSRLVGKEFNQDKQAGLFAATPPLEALKLLVSHAATVHDHDDDRVKRHATERNANATHNNLAFKVLIVPWSESPRKSCK